MALKLSDIRAPNWVWTNGAGKSYKMRPLSLATFAEAELMGCGLDQLLSDNEQQSIAAWILLYAFLADISPEDASVELSTHPKMFEGFAKHVQTTFLPPTEDESNETKKGTHRKSKDPRDKIKSMAGDSVSSSKDRKDQPGSDYVLLFDLARYMKISIDDLYKMTFTGLIGLSKHLEDNPPMPTGLFGGEGI